VSAERFSSASMRRTASFAHSREPRRPQPFVPMVTTGVSPIPSTDGEDQPEAINRATCNAEHVTAAPALVANVSHVARQTPGLDDKQRSGLLQVRLSRGTITQAVIAGSEVVQEKRKGPPRGRAFLVA
jgi:hypothetical protein